MGLINGQEYPLYFKENLPNNVSRDGMNGSTQVSKKLNGVEHRTKSFCSLRESSLRNGGLSLLLLAVPQPNALKDIKNFLI